MIGSVYRAIELGRVWTGALIIHEVYLCVIVGAVMALATLKTNTSYPLPASWETEAPISISMNGTCFELGYGGLRTREVEYRCYRIFHISRHCFGRWAWVPETAGNETKVFRIFIEAALRGLTQGLCTLVLD
jgi:hypothetical protein